MHDFLRKHVGHSIKVVSADQDRKLVYSFTLLCSDCSDEGHFPYIGYLDEKASGVSK